MENIIKLQQNAIILSQIHYQQAMALLQRGNTQEAERYFNAANRALTEAQNYGGILNQYLGIGPTGYDTDFGRKYSKTKRSKKR